MREWALHIMDLMENSLRAGASTITVSISLSTAAGAFEVVVEDNGAGLDIPLERAGDPFYTTKPGKAVGLGLSLFRASVEEAGGAFRAEKPARGGLRVAGIMPLANVDRKPLGDLAETFWTMAAAHPDVEFRISAQVDGARRALSWQETRAADKGARGNIMRQARHFAELLRQTLSDVEKIEQGFNGFERKGKEQIMVESVQQSACACACSCGEENEQELFARLDEIIGEYRNKPGALIPVLQMAQGLFGYLPERVLRRVATALNKPYSEVAGVVGFYAFFSTQPRGKHLIRVCLGTACYVRGGKQVLDAMKKALGIDVGQTTPDRLFTLDVARCFGACGLAPAISIDDEVHQRVKPARVGEILKKYAEKASAPSAAKGAAK